MGGPPCVRTQGTCPPPPPPQERGIDCIEMPLIEHCEGEDLGKLAGQLREGGLDYVCVTSPEAARVFAAEWQRAGSPALRVTVVGKGTAREPGKALYLTARLTDERLKQYHEAVCLMEGGPGTGVRRDVPRALRILRRLYHAGWELAVITTNALLAAHPEHDTLRRCALPSCGRLKHPCRGARFRLCQRCAGEAEVERTYYCCAAHQREDWARHWGETCQQVAAS